MKLKVTDNEERLRSGQKKRKDYGFSFQAKRRRTRGVGVLVMGASRGPQGKEANNFSTSHGKSDTCPK